jgi:hypothetical protein
MTTPHDAHNGSAKTTGRGRSDDFSGPAEAPDLALASADMAQEALDEGEAAAKRLHVNSIDWFDWAQASYAANIKAWIALFGCRSVPAAMAVQSSLFQEQTKIFVDHGRCMQMTSWNTALKSSEGHKRPH